MNHGLAAVRRFNPQRTQWPTVRCHVSVVPAYSTLVAADLGHERAYAGFAGQPAAESTTRATMAAVAHAPLTSLPFIVRAVGSLRPRCRWSCNGQRLPLRDTVRCPTPRFEAFHLQGVERCAGERRPYQPIAVFGVLRESSVDGLGWPAAGIAGQNTIVFPDALKPGRVSAAAGQEGVGLRKGNGPDDDLCNCKDSRAPPTQSADFPTTPGPGDRCLQPGHGKNARL